MKKILFILLACVFAFVSCTEKTEIYVYPEVVLDVSTPHLIFDAIGGERTVIVTSNYSWEYTCADNWVSVSKGNSFLEVSVGENNSSDNRYATITVTAYGGEGSLSEEISVAQTAVEGIDLSGKPANCFVVNTGTTYYFDATIKGCGTNNDYGGAKAYISQCGLNLNVSDIVYADLLWEAAFDADKTRSSEIIDGNPIYNNGYVWFTTGTSEGNASIAVKDAQGTVLWSWHIWVCDSEIGEVPDNGFNWMDRNLGAISVADGDINNRGMLYQWGRKDPFLPSCAEYGVVDANVFNTQVGNGSGKWNYVDVTTKRASVAPGNISFSIENPMSMLQGYGSVYAWYLTTTNSDLYESYLWGDSSNDSFEKSIFDPCPAGYTMPHNNPWNADETWESGQYGRYWNNAYYPASGYISGGDGHVSGEEGYFWTADTTEGSYYSNYFAFSISSNPMYGTYYPIAALSVRCVKEE